MSAEIDHVIVATSDIDAAADRIYDRHGLASVAGGRHPGHGTANRIVPLGPDYIEIMGIVDKEEAAHSPLGRWLQRQAVGGDRPAGLCLRTPDVSVTGRRLRCRVDEMSRLRPDGVELRWRLAGLAEALAEPPLPFFITWDIAPVDHPGRAPADHRVEPAGIAWVELGIDEARLHAWIGAESDQLRACDGEPSIRRVGIETGAGRVVLL